MNRNCQFLNLCVIAMVLIGTTIANAEKSNSAIAFEHLTSLVGQWTGVQDGVDITLTYTLTADGSTLMEEFRPAKGPVMMTMFTVDGDHLIATHYCSAGNQPQMVTQPITESQNTTLVFSLVHITGMNTRKIGTIQDWKFCSMIRIISRRNGPICIKEKLEQRFSISCESRVKVSYM